MVKSSTLGAIFGVIVSSLTFCQRAWAQNPSNYYIEEPRTFYGGIVAGGNFTQVDGDSYAGYHNVGLNLGPILYAQFASKIAGSIEILYSQKGAHSTFSQPSTSKAFLITKQDIRLNYVEIPLQLNYFDKRKSHFGGGISISRLISSKETIETNPNVNYDPDKYPFKKMDYNFVLGGQLHLWKGLFMNLRFQYSLVPIRKDIDLEFGRGEQYNNMWTLRMMYLFD